MMSIKFCKESITLTLKLEMPVEFEKDLQTAIFATIKQVIQEIHIENSNKEWMSLKEGAAYAGVSYNTLMKFRFMGLKICEIDGVKRISKSEIDNFLNQHSF